MLFPSPFPVALGTSSSSWREACGRSESVFCATGPKMVSCHLSPPNASVFQFWGHGCTSHKPAYQVPAPLTLEALCFFFFISSGCRILIMLIRGVYAPLYFRASFGIKNPLQSGRCGRGELTVASSPYNIIICLFPAAQGAQAQM